MDGDPSPDEVLLAVALGSRHEGNERGCFPTGAAASNNARPRSKFQPTTAPARTGARPARRTWRAVDSVSRQAGSERVDDL
jgi:hypothetical protein